MSRLEQLVIAYQTTGDERIFNAIFGAMHEAVQGIAKTRTVNHRTFDFDDAYQHCSMGLYAAIDTWDPNRKAPFVPFARMLMRRHVHKALKKEMSYKNFFPTTWLRDDGSEYRELGRQDPEPTILRDALRYMKRAKLFFDENDVKVFVLHYEQDLSYREVGARLGMSYEAVRLRLDKIHEQLERGLK